MRFDAVLHPSTLNDSSRVARAAEDYGFGALWTSETSHNPFLPLTLAAIATRRIHLGTGIAVAFPRSPMVTAQIAWDLAAQSGGRFILGLGTQVKQHITKRFSSEWGAPVEKLRDYIGAMRAIWRTFQTGGSLRYGGEFYRHTLMTPFFNPGAIEHPEIPVYIAGVNEGLCRLAGEICDGFHVHPFHTPRYLAEVIHPAIAEGTQQAGRTNTAVQTVCALFVVTGNTPAETAERARFVRQQVAFYASTPSYAPVLALHGWEDLHLRLNALSREGKWGEMGDLISDEVLHQFAVIGAPDELAHAVKARYAGLLDRVSYYFPFNPDDPQMQALWQNAADVFADVFA